MPTSGVNPTPIGGSTVPLGGISTPSTGPINGSTGGTNTPTSEPHSFYWTDGWYIALACGGGILLANTRIGPVWYGILAIALIYQTNLLLQGK